VLTEKTLSEASVIETGVFGVGKWLRRANSRNDCTRHFPRRLHARQFLRRLHTPIPTTLARSTIPATIARAPIPTTITRSPAYPHTHKPTHAQTHTHTQTLGVYKRTRTHAHAHTRARLLVCRSSYVIGAYNHVYEQVNVACFPRGEGGMPESVADAEGCTGVPCQFAPPPGFPRIPHPDNKNPRCHWSCQRHRGHY